MLIYTGFIIYRLERYRRTQIFNLKNEMILYFVMLYVLVTVKLLTMYSTPFEVSFIITNILTFIPVGIMSVLISFNVSKVYKVMAASLFLSIVIQIYLVMNGHIIDITSVLLNGVGALIGLIMFNRYEVMKKRIADKTIKEQLA